MIAGLRPSTRTPLTATPRSTSTRKPPRGSWAGFETPSDSTNKEDGAELTVGPVRVEGEHNDYNTGRRAHPFDFLQWPTVLECEAPAGTPDEVVQPVTAVLEALWHGGFKAVATCDFEGGLPARGGIDRYPRPTSTTASDASAASSGSWWRNVMSSGKRQG